MSGFLALALSFAVILGVTRSADPTPKACPFTSTQKGHNEPFGHHARQWYRVENRFDAITAEEFYAEYVRPSKPVVIRGGIGDWPAIEKWPNLTYMSEMSGDTLFQVDWRRIYDFDRAHTTHAIRRRLKMDDYIYRLGKENVYMDSPLTKGMYDDMMWPQVMNCEYFIKKMRAPSFFFNDGKSSTDVHIDGTETLFFQVSGRRLWLMTPPENARYMYSGEEYFHPHSGISKVNQNKIDLKEFPNIGKSTIYGTVVYPGDLVYVPEAWFHNVKARGNPNMATTIFFDASNCEKIFSSENDANFVVSCDKHRSIFLPKQIECPNKLPKGTTFNDVARKYGAGNPKLKPTFNIKERKNAKQQRERFLKGLFWNKAFKSANVLLPRMALNADIAKFLQSMKNKSQSIMETHYSLFHLTPEDIPALAEHLTRFSVPRKAFQVILTVPHEVSGAGAKAVTAWLEDALARFGGAAPGPLDLVLLEAPPCLPASEGAQDCARDSAATPARLEALAELARWRQADRIRLLGVKDVSAAELARLHAAVPPSALSVVSGRFDPLYRQIELRKAASKLKMAFMAHSTSGSGWVRDGLAKDNPIITIEPLLMHVFGKGTSLLNVMYEWVLRRGFLLMPERIEVEVRAELEFPMMRLLGVFGDGAGSEMDATMRRLVPKDSKYKYVSYD